LGHKQGSLVKQQSDRQKRDPQLPIPDVSSFLQVGNQAQPPHRSIHERPGAAVPAGQYLVGCGP